MCDFCTKTTKTKQRNQRFFAGDNSLLACGRNSWVFSGRENKQQLKGDHWKSIFYGIISLLSGGFPEGWFSVQEIHTIIQVNL